MNIVPIMSILQNNQHSNFEEEQWENAFDYSYLINEDGEAEPITDPETIAMFEEMDRTFAEYKKRRRTQEIIVTVMGCALWIASTVAWLWPI